ncbi:hypothetical protein G6F56_005188 [Rhizopus delemar]|nr:hypothetical protein G6F56_005188 [Rhizopus delemar]
MQQGDQEHPQIFLARLREAAVLANITSEEVVESRFRAGLMKEIKQFCIQSSSRNFKDWTNHADGWWNANRPRKIAMVDNPFIPRNVNHALIYHDDISHPHTQTYFPNHNIELIDNDEHHTQYLPVTDIYNGRRNSHYVANNQLNTMEITGRTNNTHYQIHNAIESPSNQTKQLDIAELIQKAVREEFNNNQTRNQGRSYRSNNNGYYNSSNGYYNNNNSGYYNNYKRPNYYNHNNLDRQNNYHIDYNKNSNQNENNFIRNNNDRRNEPYNRSQPQQNSNNQAPPAKN